MSNVRNEARLDRIGAIASSVCAVHCAVSALLPAAVGAMGLGFVFGHEAEWGFTLLAIAFATGALVLGWRRHRSAMVAGLLVMGIVGLLASRVIEMNSHHAHHDEHAESAHGEHGAHEEHSEGAEAHAHQEDSGMGHLLGTGVGVAAGMLLIAGHILNLRAGRRCSDKV